MTNPISLPTALARGFAMRCPNCGRGHLFGRFLKVADRCEICGEDFTPQRADDFPAYLVIVVVGHIVVPTLLAVEIAYAPPAWLELLIWLPVTLISSLALLQPTKGAIVALQWQTRMHGFAESRRLRVRAMKSPASSFRVAAKRRARNSYSRIRWLSIPGLRLRRIPE
jgi:uncharacterized protein (DUF983 family)